ncbi:transcriptional regulator [Sphingobium cloacae]|uniref:Transcriptional regulator n=1 Tax=Sphingobium cloacae TaxID=120107 RepID=A0A1E1F2Q3_9SPHN|nr:transcriptional regulator [Sphingobium cloacae]
MARRIPWLVIGRQSQGDPQFIENPGDPVRLGLFTKFNRCAAERIRQFNRFLGRAWSNALRGNDVSQKHAFQGVNRGFRLGHGRDSHSRDVSENDRIARSIFMHRQNEETR